MKRKLLLIFVFLMVIFIPSVRADENMKVIFNTSFEEKIDINKIDEIFIMMDDANLKDYEIVLEKKDNFRFELNNLPQGDVVINSITVSRDYTVNYDYQYAITKTSEEEMNISLLVTQVQKDPNRKKVQITQEEIAEMLGYDPLKLNNTGTTSTPITSNESENTSQANPDDPVDISPNKTTTESTTTTMDKQEILAQEREEEAKERKEEQKKRNKIYLIVIIIFIAILLVVGVIAGIKIANANK